jgi:hypothetical protein
MKTEKTLAEQVAENRLHGLVRASNKALFANPTLPTWKALRVDWYVPVVWVTLLLYFVSLYVLADMYLPLGPVSLHDFLRALAISAVNYFILIWSACQILAKFEHAHLNKLSWGNALVVSLVLNPLFLGWLVPVYVLYSARKVKARLQAA